VAWLDRLEAENGNLRAVLAWSTGSPEAAEIGLRLGGALLWFWVVRGYFGEGGRALQAVLAASPDANPAVRAKALLAAGHLAQYERDFARSTSLLDESIRISRGLHDEEAHARALSLLGETARVEGDLDRATVLMEEALAMQRRLSDRWGTYHTLHRLGEAARNQGRFDRAEELHAESLALRQAMRDFRGIGAAYQSLGLLALGRGDFVEAQRVLRDALAHHRLTRNRFGTAMCLEGLFDIALARNDLVHAARLLGVLESGLEAMGVALLMAERARFERNRAELQSRMDEQELEAIRAEGRAMNVDEAIEYALTERV
jgi:non-specific serine/threonine protein kinase